MKFKTNLLQKVMECNDLTDDEMTYFRFRWVQCQLDYLKGLKRDCARRTALNSLPSGLTSTYLRVLERISRIEDDWIIARTALTWLVYCEGDLTVSQLATAAAIDPDIEFDNERRLDDTGQILGICSCLIKKSPAREIVSLAHLSVREFLTTQTFPDGTKNAYFVSEQDGNLLLSRACFSYLSSRYFELDQQGPPRTRPIGDDFFNYAVCCWRQHVLKSSMDERLLRPIIGFFKTGKHQTWLKEWHRQEKSQRAGLYSSFYGGISSLQAIIQADVLPPCSPPPPLYVAVTLQYPQVTRMLLNENHDPNECGGYLDYPLFAAIQNENLEDVVTLLAAKANPNATRGDGQTPLHIAASFWLKDIVKALLSSGAKVCAKTSNGKTPLVMALELSPALGDFTLRRKDHRVADVDLDLIECLLIDPGFYGVRETTPLHVAVEEIQFEVVKYIFLKQWNVHLNVPDENGNTPLHLAARSSCAEMAEWLINHGAVKTLSNDQGWTPLHIAVWEQDLKMIETLEGTVFKFHSPQETSASHLFMYEREEMWRNTDSPSSLRWLKTDAQESLIMSTRRSKSIPDHYHLILLSDFIQRYPSDYLYTAFLGACLLRLGHEIAGMDAHELSLSCNPRNLGAVSVKDLFHGIPCNGCSKEIRGELYKCHICWRSYCAECPDPCGTNDCRKHVLKNSLPRNEWRKRRFSSKQTQAEPEMSAENHGCAFRELSQVGASTSTALEGHIAKDSDNLVDILKLNEPKEVDNFLDGGNVVPTPSSRKRRVFRRRKRVIFKYSSQYTNVRFH